MTGFKNIKHFNCSLDFLFDTFIDCRSHVILQCFFGGVIFFFHWHRCWKLPPWIFLVAMLFTLWLCCVFPFHWSDIYRSSQNWRLDPFQKWKLYRQTQTPSWLLSISRVIRIWMRVIRLTSGKPCMCYYTCGYMIFMTWVIILNNLMVMW